MVLNFCGLKLLVPPQRKQQIGPLQSHVDVEHLQEEVSTSEPTITDDEGTGTLNPSISESLVYINDGVKKPIWPPKIPKHRTKLRPHRPSLTEAAAIFLTPPGVHSMPQAQTEMTDIKEGVPVEEKAIQNMRSEKFLEKSCDDEENSSDDSEVPAIV